MKKETATETKETKVDTKAVKAEDTKAVEAVKAEEKKATKTAVKKTPAKTTAKKTTTTKKATTTKTTEAKETLESHVVVQTNNSEIVADDLIKKALNAYKEEGNKTKVKGIDIYIKPEENAAYYVINDKIAGRVDIF
ncbi:MAG: hypothetical protein K2M73_02885 [Lachnospiraceae bacterium]|nr:hypothetical protein [Lachnospiraceae bacterium]